MTTRSRKRQKKAAARKSKAARDGSSDAAEFLDSLLGPLTFGNALRAIRQGEEWTQSILASRLGTTKQHISDVEREKKSVSPDRAAAWAKVLGQSERLFVQLALQDELRRAALDYTVTLESA